MKFHEKEIENHRDEIRHDGSHNATDHTISISDRKNTDSSMKNDKTDFRPDECRNKALCPEVISKYQCDELDDVSKHLQRHDGCDKMKASVKKEIYNFFTIDGNNRSRAQYQWEKAGHSIPNHTSDLLSCPGLCKLGKIIDAQKRREYQKVGIRKTQ